MVRSWLIPIFNWNGYLTGLKGAWWIKLLLYSAIVICWICRVNDFISIVIYSRYTAAEQILNILSRQVHPLYYKLCVSAVTNLNQSNTYHVSNTGSGGNYIFVCEVIIWNINCARHYAKLSRAMRAPWMNRFGNNQIYCCYFLYKMRCGTIPSACPARGDRHLMPAAT